MTITTGQTIAAPDCTGKVRNWTVVCEPYYEGPHEGLLVAGPHHTDDERATVEKVTRINEARRSALPHGVNLNREVIEIASVIH